MEPGGQAVPPGSCGRVVDLRVGGRPVRDDDRFMIATNSYRLSNDAAGAAIRARAEAVEGLSVGAALERHIAAGGAEEPLPAPAWGFRPLAETTVLFPTGPGARTVAPPGGAAAGIVRPAGWMDEAGFDLHLLDLARADLLGPSEFPEQSLGRRA
jgi:hypothetical protein